MRGNKRTEAKHYYASAVDNDEPKSIVEQSTIMLLETVDKSDNILEQYTTMLGSKLISDESVLE